MRTAVAALAVVLGACGGSPMSEVPTEGDGATTATVVGVTDGDTIRVELDGSELPLRLIGIDAPERRECFADEATAALRDLVGGRQVTLVRDTSDRDRHGRLLRYVSVDGEHVNATLVQQGFALARRYPPDTARAEELAAAEEQARADGAGLWGPDGCGYEGTAEVTLDVHADAPGDDAQNLNGEWLDLRNDGTDELDLAGWTVRDGSATKRYVFPEGTLLAAGATLRLLSGCGEDDRTVRHWCHEGSAIWNNDGDIAMLLDPQDRIVATHRYGDAADGR